MRIGLLASLLFWVTFHARSQVTVNGSLVHGGITRTYSFYVPASYVAGQAVPLVLNLHGTSTDGAYQAQYRDFRPIADTANFIVAHPDGSTMLGQRFWNYGNVLGSTVDDVGFLEAMIDAIAAQYAINPERVYCAGMSNGSFMSYCLACRSDRFAAIAGVTGSMSVDMYNTCTPTHPTPVIHIHGTSDGTNPYAGNSTMKGVEAVSLFWANQNGCNPTPAITAVPNTNTSDNATAERYLYSGGTNGRTVELFKVTGGGHTWPGSPVSGSSGNTCMDFDASKEIWRFFSQYQHSGVVATEDLTSVEVKIWPNPAAKSISIELDNHTITEIRITDMQGRVVEEQTNGPFGQVNISQLETGNYMVHISGEGFVVVRKMVVWREE